MAQADDAWRLVYGRKARRQAWVVGV